MCEAGKRWGRWEWECDALQVKAGKTGQRRGRALEKVADVCCGGGLAVVCAADYKLRDAATCVV